VHSKTFENKIAESKDLAYHASKTVGHFAYFPVRKRAYAILTVNIVFFSMIKMPRTLKPIGFPCRRSRNRFSCKRTIMVVYRKST